MEAPPGEPLPGLSDEERQRFFLGQSAFNRAFTPAEGLGPLFNQARCSSCHDLPTSGGHGAEPVRKVAAWDGARGCDPLVALGGPLLQRSATPEAQAAGLDPELLPAGTTLVVELVPPPLYGLGLVEAVPTERIAAAADPDDTDGDGISGRLAEGAGGGAGLFGMKGAHPSLFDFIEDAARGEMGLTSPGLPDEERPGGAAVPPAADPAPDPEVDAAFLERLTDYVTFLAPPGAADMEDPAEREAVEWGREVFEDAGCQDCHTPHWTTGRHESPALDRRTFRAYSDFLLHDLGPEMASLCAPGSTPSEWRTARLVGLSHRQIFLHDGRAQNLTSSIEYHGGEAAASRERFRGLDEASKAALLRFLQSL